MADIAQRYAENPILRPADVRPSIAGMQVECLLNPGVFRFDGKTWLLLRGAERPFERTRAIRRCSAKASWRRMELKTAAWYGSTRPTTSLIPRSRRTAWAWACARQPTG